MIYAITVRIKAEKIRDCLDPSFNTWYTLSNNIPNYLNNCDKTIIFGRFLKKSWCSAISKAK